MKPFSLAGILLLWFSVNIYSHGQQLQVKLQGEGNGDVVRLKWIPQSWPASLEGFIIKRRSSGSGWISITASTVYPELSLNKPLENVETLPAEQRRLFQKLTGLINAKRAVEISKEQYKAVVLDKPRGLQNLAISFLVDFDFALLNGFGMIDRKIPRAEIYEYGLFPKYKDSPVAQDPISIFQWKFGDKPNTELTASSDIKRERGNGIIITWSIDTKIFKERNFVGFHIYKRLNDAKFEKMNQSLILLSVKNNPEYLTQRDTIPVNEKNTYSYAAVPVTQFGTEGTRIEAFFNPALSTATVTIPKLQHVPGISDANKIDFVWDLVQTNEVAILGFQIERKSDASGSYQLVSEVLPPSTRKFSDMQLSKSGYFFYRLKLIGRDKEMLFSNEVVLFYAHSQILPKPVNVSGKVIDEGGKRFVEIRWEASPDTEAQTKGYAIYVGKPTEETLYEDTRIPLITKNSYRHPIDEYASGEWKFAVVGVSTVNDRSEQSEPVTVFVSTKNVPDVNNRKMQLEGGSVKITWVYSVDDLPDLAGFRIFQNGEMVADEKILGAEKREWTSVPLESGKRYRYEIQAVTRFGVESNKTAGQITVN